MYWAESTMHRKHLSEKTPEQKTPEQWTGEGPNGRIAMKGGHAMRYWPLLVVSTLAMGQAQKIPRTADGHPDLQGFWNNASLTPLERPAALGNKEFFTAEEA